MNCHQLASPLIFWVSWIAVRNDRLSMTIAASSTATGTHCHLSIGSGWLILCQAS